MKKELGFGYCGLVCALCKENTHCVGCKQGVFQKKKIVKIINVVQQMGIKLVMNVKVFLVRIVFS